MTESHPSAVPDTVDHLSVWSYHAHVYFEDNAQRRAAELLRERIGERFTVQLGRWHDVLIGPHSLPMYQVAFATALFPVLVPWLMQNRLGLTILVHPNTGQPRADHLVHALWLGRVLAIQDEVLPDAASFADDDLVQANTTPSITVVGGDDVSRT